MALKEGYDVLRLIEHGQSCYVSSEYVTGQPVTEWLRYHKEVEKKVLFSWIQEITRQLGLIHRCRGNPCYQYVNPYNLIRAEEGSLYFLDMDAQSNEERQKLMKKRSIREHFLPAEEKYYHKASVRLDMYGLGKTIQYLMASAVPEPPLLRKEEKKFQKAISKCLKGQSKHVQNVSEIRKYLPIYQEKKGKGLSRKRKAVVIGCSAGLFAAGGGLLVSNIRRTGADVEDASHTEEIDLEEETDLEAEKEIGREQSYLELARVYFLELKDYKKCLEYLEKAGKGKGVEAMKVVVESLAGGEKTGGTKELKEALDFLDEYRKEAESEMKDWYYLCVIQGYAGMNDRESHEKVLRIGSAYLEEEEETDGTEEIGRDRHQEVKEYMAAAYEATGNQEEAAGFYEEVLKSEDAPEKKEDLYKKIILLYEAAGQADKAAESCGRGIEELEESQELRIMHLRLLCKDEGVAKELCVQKVREYIVQIPELAENEEFKKLQKEYEIRIEGEEIWVGN